MENNEINLIGDDIDVRSRKKERSEERKARNNIEEIPDSTRGRRKGYRGGWMLPHSIDYQRTKNHLFRERGDVASFGSRILFLMPRFLLLLFYKWVLKNVGRLSDGRE
ncbi:hypothetical protein M5689_005541 [Euphorbia peplus]|nr:hypothetical protein M5689_005541 [Euphorbia peplus]